MASDEVTTFAQAVSRLFGWLYFASWSASFYPQPYANWKRKATSGFAIDYPTLNILGFTSYTISTGAFFFNPTIRRQYAARNPQEPIPTVRFNDFLFAIHGAILCVVVYSQFWPRLWGFTASEQQRSSRTVLGIVSGCVLGVVGVIFLVLAKSPDGGYDPRGWAWIEVIYAISYVKLITVLIKYIPQVIMNYQRQSTHGFHMATVWTDFIGGILSVGQLLIDSSLQADWSGVTGNPAKFMLANISMVFNVIFFVQHYILYRGSGSKEEDAEASRPLIGNVR